MGRRGPARTNTPDQLADKQREYNRANQRRATASVQEIGRLPPVQNPKRREAAGRSLEVFCKTYLPWTFTLPFSPDHRSVIAKIERAVTEGGLFAMAMPRGSGKTTLSEAACLWAILYGHRSFVMLIGASADAATEMLESIKTELEVNDLLDADFPQAVHPIRLLEGEPRRCKGQTYTPPDGKPSRTHSKWGKDEIVIPTIPGSEASGAVIRVAGITGRVRGQKFKRPDGKTVRPDFVLVDDPQTDASANSQSQCTTRERTLAGAILGLAGPGKRIAGVMPCTVVRAGDVADRAIDSKIHPEWNGSRHKLLYKFPVDMDKWREYRDRLLSYAPAIPGDKERAEAHAAAFYLEHCEEMDAGAEVAWNERYEPGELSAVQNAMNLFFRDERAFAAEYQNEPLPEATAETVLLTSTQIAQKVNRFHRGHAPVTATRLTCGIDVQKSILFYAVVAWQEDFTGFVVDYGTYPDQGRPYFTLSQVDRTLAKETKIAGLEGQLFAGISTLTNLLCSKDWKHGQGGKMRIERCIVDAGYETDTVFSACRQSMFSAVVMPAHGKGIGAVGTPMSQWPQRQGEKRGLNWIVPVAQKRDIRPVIFETNFWADFLFSRLAVAAGNPGCLSLWGDSEHIHRMFADHLAAECYTEVEAKGRKVNEWKCKPNMDNHWFDCLRMATVGAAMQGSRLLGVHQSAAPKKRVRFSEQHAAAQERARR